MHAGENSTINYVMPWVSTEDGFDTLLELHLDEVNVLTSVNDIRVLSAKSSRVRNFYFSIHPNILIFEYFSGTMSTSFAS